MWSTVIPCFAARMGWIVGTCEVAKRPARFVWAPVAAAQVKHSKPSPLKSVGPPKPRQRPTGTSASKSISSLIAASEDVLGQSAFSVPSIVEIAQP